MDMLFNFGKKKAPSAPTKKGVPIKKAVSGFAGGLVGSDVEAPNFDPLQLSVGRNEETLAWYRAAELKVFSKPFNIYIFFYSNYSTFFNFNMLALSYLHACSFRFISSTSISSS